MLSGSDWLIVLGLGAAWLGWQIVWVALPLSSRVDRAPTSALTFHA